jgi:acetyltransferase-like isoleucine patch superfamily enzyme
MGSGWKKLRRGTRRLYTIAYAGLVGARTGSDAIVMRGAVLKPRVWRRHHHRVGHRGSSRRDADPLGRLHPPRLSLPRHPYSVLYGHGGLEIGDYVRIAAHCVIVPANHGIALDEGLIADQPMSKRGIRIGNDVWLGAGVRVLDGSVIGDGCVVAAGSVVRGELEPYAIYAGVPAKLVRMRSATTYLKDRRHETVGTEIPASVATS